MQSIEAGHLYQNFYHKAVYLGFRATLLISRKQFLNFSFEIFIYEHY